ncbi:uncharacterized protein MYCFIDRAFT_71596 [Pseudocercospora fijiensis CIRAD86]|uniref:WW domain-containing protein n=1 Tax=Pseudocercospora fijiensis (strain CIRAD86) TaxID=383855 RepID=M3A6Z1_PSEFD|nr:uncharacterized protein MYCFIDRAFT_71596 [Pseudocercospora fijiensis CIRAD86]EME86864.1 hypothetical protein MYCFIDRAFT_71596 [Pseudocercospora fijiensis CIRAD86]
MSDFAPPVGPPPPKVPEGWKAVWNDQYKEWFYVNTHTKQSQWDKPTEAAHATSGDAPPGGAPPGYDHSQSKSTGPEKPALGSNNPFNGTAGGAGSSHAVSEDERLARQLQQEEDARAQQSSRGASDSYYQGGAANQQSNYGSPYGVQSPAPGQEGDRGSKSKGGLFGKLKDKLGAAPPSSSRPGYAQQYGQQQYGGGYAQQGHGGYPPPQQYGGYPQQGYGGYPPQGGYYGGQQAPRRGGGGMGAMGGAALGVGAGLIGGALIADAIGDREDEAYQEGYDDGQDGDMGGDF